MKGSGKCPKCGHDKIIKEEGIILSGWFKRDFKVDFFHCDNCGFIEQYFAGKEMQIF